MYFERIPDLTITDICIWCDNHMYDENVNEDKLLRYLYYISRRLAAGARFTFFNNKKYQDDFCLFMALEMWCRIHNYKQFDDGYPMEKIRHILEFAKSVLYPIRARFLSQFQTDKYPSEFDVEFYNNFRAKINSMAKSIAQINFKYYIEHDIINTIKKFVYKRMVYKPTSEIGHSIYMSCLLSMLSSMTLSHKNKYRLKIHTKNNLPKFIRQLYEEEQENCIILYNLPETYRDYVTILVREIKHIIAADLSDILKDEELTTDVFFTNTYLTGIEEKEK